MKCLPYKDMETYFRQLDNRYYLRVDDVYEKNNKRITFGNSTVRRIADTSKSR